MYWFALLIVSMFGSALSAFGQNQVFNDPNVEYTFEIPDTGWRMTTKPTPGNPKVELTYGDRNDGFFDVRKMTVKENEMIAEIIDRDKEGTLQFLPGYIAVGKDDVFAGSLTGKVFNYEYVKFGKTMSGRLYYLKADATTIYILRFTGLKERLSTIRNQADLIARTFKIKTA